MREPSESELIVRAKAGDAEAFSVLARAYERRIVVLALHHARDRHDAEDLSQEVWLKAFRAIKSFRGESSFYTWLRQITINTFLNHRRSSSSAPTRHGARVVELDAWEASRRDAAQASSQPPLLIQRTRGVEETLEQQFLVSRVLDALGDLTAQQRLIFLLKHHEGMTYEEIAAAVGCSTGTTKKALFRAVLKLRQRLGVAVETAETYEEPQSVRKSC
ncbi:MAG TPA: sigma-70 family RNA polymerase sigma factor [Pyrinomonadaceae bacterium]|nr:sigma-70 family RNA polymerase sigma factor [Pyrinomonadaceae bacterium]